MPRTCAQKPSTNEQTPSLVSTSDPSETTPPPSTPSFKDQLSKFHYSASSISTQTTSPASTPRPCKRTRTRTATDPQTAPSTTSSPRPKKKRKPSKYADPSKYAHLSPLTDILAPNLICVFVGTNPGVQTATAGHAYAHPSNHFWKLLHSAGLTDRRLKPEEDGTLPAGYCMGNTNIVERPSKDAAELSKEEMAAGTAKLDAKFLQYTPEAVCVVGKGIWEAIWRYRYGRNMNKDEFRYGWQDEKDNMGKRKDGEEKIDAEGNEMDAEGSVWRGAKVFVTTSTSGLAASLRPAEKEAIWKPFGEWVQKRRVERGFVPKEMGAEGGRDG